MLVFLGMRVIWVLEIYYDHVFDDHSRWSVPTKLNPRKLCFDLITLVLVSQHSIEFSCCFKLNYMHIGVMYFSSASFVGHSR